MKRGILFLLIVLDLAFLGAVGLRLWQRYGELASVPLASAPITEEPPALAPPLDPAAEVVSSTDTVVVSSATAAPAEMTEPVEGSPETAPAAAAGGRPGLSDGAESVLSSTSAAPVSVGKKTRKIRFQYVNPAVSKVSLTGDFNNWTPEPFRKSASGVWTLNVDLPPGDYSYNFIADGRTLRDPTQRRTDDKGRSLYRVSPPAP